MVTETDAARPVVLVRNDHFLTSEIARLLTIKRDCLCKEAPTLASGLQLLISSLTGLMVLCIDKKSDLLVLQRALSLLQKSVNPLHVRVVIFSTNAEVLDSRSLVQFQFVRALQTPKTGARVVEALDREIVNLNAAIANESRKSSFSFSGDSAAKPSVVAVKGPQKDKSFLPAETNPLNACIGKDVPTYLYGSTLDWRVLGYFKSIDVALSTVLFSANSSSAEKKMSTYLQKQSSSFSSSASPAGKVCSALEFVTRKKSDFQFRYRSFTKLLQRRNAPRLRPKSGDNFSLRFPDPKTKADLIFSVFDYSLEGVAFVVPSTVAETMTVGLKIQALKLFLHGRDLDVAVAEVRHVSKLGDGTFLIGLHFDSMVPRFRALLEMILFSESL